MTPLTKRIAWWGFAVAVVGLLALGGGFGARAEGTDMENGPFSALVDEYLAGHFAFRPAEATYAGIHDHDGRLDDWSPASIAAEVERLKGFRARLAAVDASKLPDVQRRDHAVLSCQIEGQLLHWEVLRPLETNPMACNDQIAWALDELVVKMFAPAEERLRRVIERERQIPRFLSDARTHLGRPPRAYTDLAIELVEGTVEYLRTTLPAAFAGVGDEALRREFGEQNAAAIAAVEAYLRYLQEDVLPRSDGDYALGKDLFLRRLRVEELVDLPLDRLEAIGTESLRETQRRFAETARRIDPGAAPLAVLESLQADHPSAEDLLSSTAASLEGMRQYLVDAEIVTIPSEERCTVVPMPGYMEAFAAMNTPGPLETVARDAYYYVDPVEPDWPEEKKEEHLRSLNRPVMEVTSIHEAYPGHFIQGLYTRQAPSVVRKAFWSYTYDEGWAHYCEQMMLEEGYGGGDPRLQLAQLSEALVRLCRYRAAIGLHTQGWTVEQATAFFVGEGYLLPESARREAVRGTYDPLYLAYTLGKLQIYELRADYAKKLGEKYTLREFHDRFLSEGSVPIRVIRDALLGDGGGDR